MADQNQAQSGGNKANVNSPNVVKPQNAQPQGGGQKSQGANSGAKQGGQQAKAQAPFQKPQPTAVEENPNFRGIVRVVGKDMDGHLTLYKSLMRVKGIGANMARALEKIIVKELKLAKKVRVGDLSEEEIDKIDEICKSPQNHGVRLHMFNRQRDRESGKNMHLLMNDLIFVQKQDIQIEKDTRTYKGWRFTIGQRVRGQHSRTTGRSGFTVGVMKKAIKEQKAAAATSAQDKGKGGDKKK